jgi:D-amino-acid dehydrogenase
MPWLLRFLNECRTSRCAANTEALAMILQHTYSGYAPLLADTPSANARLHHKGCLYAYRTQQGFATAQAAIELRNSLGIPQQVLSATQVDELEPALAGRAVAGILFPKSSHMDDPRLFIEALAAPLIANNALRKATVTALRRERNGLHVHCAGGQVYQADRVVLCGGAWSAALAAQMGDRIPLDTERGYHIEFDLQDTLLNRPCCPVESAFYMTPMVGRLRVAGTVELGSIHDPANPRRFDYLEQHVRRVLGLGEPVARRWLGLRPSLPDSLPVIGPSPNEPRLIYAFGHQHLGLTLAGATGQLVSECIAGTAPSWLERFSARRFTRR